MAKIRVPLWGKPQGFGTVETEATKGAVVGENLYRKDGSVVTEDDLGGGGEAAQPERTRVLWGLIQSIPAAVRALASITTSGLFAITGSGTGATRELQGTVGRTTVSNGDGVAGDPTVDLAVVPDSGAGATLVKITRDAYGRVSGTEAATTTDLPEGDNLYYTDARVYAAAKAQLVAGTNVSIITDDGAQLLIISASGGDSASGGEALVQDGASAPPVMLTNEAEDDFVFSG